MPPKGSKATPVGRAIEAVVKQAGKLKEAVQGATRRNMPRRCNATVTTPRGASKLDGAGAAKKRAAEEQENEPPLEEGPALAAKRRRMSHIATATPGSAAAAAKGAVCGGSSRKPLQRNARQQQEEEEQDEEEEKQQVAAAAPQPAAAAAAAPPAKQEPPPLLLLQQQPSLTSMGLEPSQSLHESILKSPTPPRRARATTSTAAGGGGGLQAALLAADGAPAAAVEAGAVNQPVPQQQQQQQHAAQQQDVEPEPAAPEPAVEAAAAEAPRAEQQQQQQEQEGGSAVPAVAAAVAAERTASTPLPKRHRTSSPGEQQQEQQGGSPATSAVAAPSAAATAALAQPAQAPADAEAAADTWWDPLDAEKVRSVKAALHIVSYAKGSIPACREKQAAAVGTWLSTGLQQRRGGSLYLSGLPGTGKSLTAHEVVRQCWRSADEAGEAVPVSPPPALLSINCMSFTDPKQVLERILLGYSQACAAPHPEAAEAAGEDPLLFPAAESSSAAGAACGVRRRSAGSSPLQELERLVLSPITDTAAAEQPASAKGKGGRGRKRKSGAGSAAAAAAAGGGSGRGMLVVVLDELDSLLTGTRGEELVADLFTLAHAPASRLLLLGIANSIDLVQQLMKPGGSLHRHNLRPAHEIFPAYQRQQFSQVLHQRLGTLPGRVFEPNAIELCSRKMANGNGDMRYALEACLGALNMAVNEAAAAAAAAGAQQQQQQQQEGAAAVAQQQQQQGSAVAAAVAAGGVGPSAAAARRAVGMRHMAAALSTITGGIGLSNVNVRAIKALPPQQQLLMCTVGKLLGDTLGSRGLAVRMPAPMPTPGSSRKATGGTAAASRARAAFMSPTNSASSRKSAGSMLSGGSVMSGMARSREVQLGQLEVAFGNLCRQVGMEAYSGPEFSSACEGLQDRGLIGLAPAREAKNRRVTLRVPEDDVVLALADVPVLRNVVGA